MAKNAVDPFPREPAEQPTPFTDSGSVRAFGMPAALVISVCVIVAAVLAALGLHIQDVLLLVGGAAAAGGTAVLLVTAGGRGGRWGRLIRAYVSAGN